MSERKNCYMCKYRGMVPGSAHSSCRHPVVKEAEESDNTFAMITQMLDGGFDGVIETLGITAHPQGIKGGWFSWPGDFDPTWLRSCKGFAQRETKEVKDE